VRALFKGPSGTGKTLAARVLAAELGLALYRVDLGAVVDKYIGETEKHLEQVFSAAETLDAMLLLDEGDALLAPRTGVASATDRYANLETNYLLQRLEAFEGILVVTSNAAERIDAAFLRRLDAVLDFPLPGAAERLALWRLHLSAEHRVPAERLQRVAQRCTLAGGQIRNVALHAALLGLQRGGPPGEAEVDAALAREYRRAGQALPPGAVESSAVAGD
jgi:SpoVK/Ycf46/Vps4 family AAA+-type ATPase